MWLTSWSRTEEPFTSPARVSLTAHIWSSSSSRARAAGTRLPTGLMDEPPPVKFHNRHQRGGFALRSAEKRPTHELDTELKAESRHARHGWESLKHSVKRRKVEVLFFLPTWPLRCSWRHDGEDAAEPNLQPGTPAEGGGRQREKIHLCSQPQRREEPEPPGEAQSYLIFISCVSNQHSTWIEGGRCGGSRCCCRCCSTADGDAAGGRRRNAAGRAATCTSSEHRGDFRPVLESTARLPPPDSCQQGAVLQRESAPLGL